MTDAERTDYDTIARWVYDTARLFGTTPETSSEVAAIFVRGLRAEHEAQRSGGD